MNKAKSRAQLRGRELNIEMRDWLSGGLSREDGRLALFDSFGEPINKAVVNAAISAGYAEAWFSSPMRPQWMVCRLTSKGRRVLSASAKTKRL